jgi:hypothetical protein
MLKVRNAEVVKTVSGLQRCCPAQLILREVHYCIFDQCDIECEQLV